MSPDRIRSPCFASQLGFSSICAILWVTSGFTDLKKHCGCWCSRTKRECHWKSLKAALHLCAYLLSLLNLFFKIESEIPSIFSYLELKQRNQNIIYTIFVFLSFGKWEDHLRLSAFFSSSAILKPALLHTTNRKATNSSGCLPGPHPVLSLCSHHTHERQELDCCSLIKQHVQHI